MAETPADGGGDGDARAVGSDVAAAGAGASIGLVGGPIGSVVGAAVAPVLARGLRAVFERYSRRQWARADRVLHLAAELAGIDDEELIERLRRTPEKEELLVRTVRAAAEAAVERKLVALAKSLAATTVGGDEEVQWEAVFVRALSDLDTVHINLLERFTWSANALGLGDGGPEFTTSPASLSSVQLAIAVPHLENVVDAVLATLVRHGLLAFASHTNVTYGGGSPAPSTWSLTPFGRTVLSRLGVIADVLQREPRR
jgi:hypothetical protein